jgi:hypothetical protein
MTARRQPGRRVRGLGQTRAKSAGGIEDGVREAGVSGEIAAEFSTEELLEFLEADQLPVEADPEFRERLRSELWSLVQSLALPKR